MKQLDPRQRPLQSSWWYAEYAARCKTESGREVAMRMAACAAMYEAEDERIESHTLTVRTPYFQEQLEAVKADSSSHSDQPLPVAAPKPAHRHWSNALATPVAAPVSLSLPRAWELRK